MNEIFVRQLLKGEFKLVKTFWLYFFLPIFVLRFLAAFIGGPIGALFQVCALLWAGFMMIPVWKSADHYEGNFILAWLAKGVAILTGISILLSFQL